jgi:hypothetical protein
MAGFKILNVKDICRSFEKGLIETEHTITNIPIVKGRAWIKVNELKNYTLAYITVDFWSSLGNLESSS